MGFNECLGFLDPLMGVYGLALKFEVFQVGMKGFFYRTAAAQMRKRAVTLGIPTGCVQTSSYVCANRRSPIRNGALAILFILQKRYSFAKNNPNENKITSIISPLPSFFESFLLRLHRHWKSLQRERRAHRRHNHERGVHGLQAKVVSQRTGGSGESLVLMIMNVLCCPNT